MRIGFLCLNEATFTDTFRPLSRRLEKLKVQTKFLYASEWWNFDFSEIEAFRPNLLVVWNGNFNWQHAAIRHLSAKYRMAYMENGWLPQAGNVYLDFEGVGSKSSIFRSTPNVNKGVPDFGYRPKPVPYEDYILLPMQLPMDTTILYDSPIFKTMETFTNFVVKHFPGERLVVKPHPKEPAIKPIEGTIYADPHTPIEDLLANCKAVVGINSTTLIEALAFRKPVAAYGYNLAFNKKVLLEMPKDPRDVLNWRPDRADIDRCLSYLSGKQFPVDNPPLHILESLMREAARG